MTPCPCPGRAGIDWHHQQVPGRGASPGDPPGLSWPWQWAVPGAHPSKSPALWQEDLCHQDTEFLCTQLKVLATESNKYRAKTDRRRQRSIFRDILHFIEVMEPGAALPCHCVAAFQLPHDSSLWRARGHIGLVPRLLLMPLSLLRVGSTRRRPSGLAWSACIWTAGHASAPTKPLRRCWALVSTTTSR